MSDAKWQKIDIKIPRTYTSIERQAIAVEIINFIRKRTTEDNVDKNNRAFKGYSKAYTKSLDFKIAGKSKGDVNLVLSGDMLGALGLLGESKGKIRIGFDDGSFENAKADGNIRGTYGKSPGTGPRRDFLGITKADLAEILKNYKPGSDDSLSKSQDLIDSREAADIPGIETEDDG